MAVVHPSPSNPFALEVINSIENQTAIDCLSLSCPQISIKKLKLAMTYGAVWLSREKSKTVRVRRAKRKLLKGDKLSIYFDEKILFSPISPAQLISDEGEYSIWNKPSGMFSQGTKWGDHSSIARWVELFGLAKNDLDLRPAFLVHRLDRATSGIILLAHSKKMAAS
ncbi:MAG: pseudouridine synthase [Kangiellaceae bacterium]|nr:pseudouridine synthase [Kangiellaceae bacterium]